MNYVIFWGCTLTMTFESIINRFYLMLPFMAEKRVYENLDIFIVIILFNCICKIKILSFLIKVVTENFEQKDI